MKNFCTILCLFLGLATIDAQISKIKKIDNNKISNTKISRIIATPKRIEAEKLNKLKPDQIAKLPAATFDREALSKLVISKHWELTPKRLRDKDMYIDEYFGKYESQPKYISVYAENKYYPNLDRGRPGFLPEYRHLIIKFRPKMGQRYRMQLKLKPGNYRGKKIITDTSGGSYADSWFINDQYDELMFDFVASSQTIKVTPIIAGRENYYVIYEPLEIEKINIDKVE